MIRFWAAIKTLHQKKKKKKKQKISLFCQNKEKIKSKGSFFKEKYGSGGWNTISLKSHNSTSTCLSEKRFSAFYSPSNSLSDDISLTLKLKKIHFIHFGVVDPCDVMIWHFASNKTLRLPGQHAIKVNLPSLVKKWKEMWKICKFTYPISTPRGHWKFQRGGPVLKAKIFKQEYEAKLEFPEAVSRAFKPKNHPWGATWFFSGMIHCKHFDMFSATNCKTVPTKSGSSHLYTYG